MIGSGVTPIYILRLVTIYNMNVFFCILDSILTYQQSNDLFFNTFPVAVHIDCVVYSLEFTLIIFKRSFCTLLSSSRSRNPSMCVIKEERAAVIYNRFPAPSPNVAYSLRILKHFTLFIILYIKSRIV